MEGQRRNGGRRTVSGGPLDGKPFAITGHEVRLAWQKVKGNRGAPGVDDVSIAAFEERLEDNLYRIWNRMSSGSYFPPPVRAVEIPNEYERAAWKARSGAAADFWNPAGIEYFIPD